MNSVSPSLKSIENSRGTNAEANIRFVFGVKTVLNYDV